MEINGKATILETNEIEANEPPLQESSENWTKQIASTKNPADGNGSDRWHWWRRDVVSLLKRKVYQKYSGHMSTH